MQPRLALKRNKAQAPVGYSAAKTCRGESCTHLERRSDFRVSSSHGGYLAAEAHVMVPYRNVRVHALLKGKKGIFFTDLLYTVPYKL